MTIAAVMRLVCFKDQKTDQKARREYRQRNNTNILHHYYPKKTAHATIATKQKINLYEILAVKYCLNLNNSA